MSPSKRTPHHHQSSSSILSILSQHSHQHHRCNHTSRSQSQLQNLSTTCEKYATQWKCGHTKSKAGKKCLNAANGPCSISKHKEPIIIEQDPGYCASCLKKNSVFRAEQEKLDAAQFAKWQKDQADEKAKAWATEKLWTEVKGGYKKGGNIGGKRKRDEEDTPDRLGGIRRGPGRKIGDGKKPRERHSGAISRPPSKPADMAPPFCDTEDEEVLSEAGTEDFIVSDGSDDGEKNYTGNGQSSPTGEGGSDHATTHGEGKASDTSIPDDGEATASDPHDSDMADTASPGSQEDGSNSDEGLQPDDQSESNENPGSEDDGELVEGESRYDENDGGDTAPNSSPRSEPDAAPMAIPAVIPVPVPATVPQAAPAPAQQQPAAGPTCTKITKKGTRCKRNPYPGRALCRQH